MIGIAKRSVRALARAMGQQLISGKYRLTLTQVLRHARANGLRPQTLIDVGVARAGTPDLYDSFPEAKLLLVEPNADCEPTLAELARTRGGGYVLAAAGSAPGYHTRPRRR